ncbi:hypothetical protein GCM10022239_03800 [Leifsonia bigeumensis]|uniref:DNA polymerase III beta sliding clamp central domain-containing protein n=1 Tax=Leifsonella bigeumensis TaxID=433643 RepID=A0ABP7F355_9MICO
MSTITLSREQARYLVDVALSAASTDDVTPVICGAHITVEDGKLRVVCTDRYRAHTALLKAEKIDGDLDFIIPRDALQWLKANYTYFGSSMRDFQRVTIEVTPHPDGPPSTGPGEVVVTVQEFEAADANSVRWKGKHIRGNFPPVIKLIETARDAEAVLATPRLRLDYLSRMSALSRLGRQDSPWVKCTSNTNPNKPGPVYVSWRDGSGVYAEALIQPNLEPTA